MKIQVHKWAVKFFEKINFTQKLEKKISLDFAKEELSKFTKVIDQQECYVVKYDLVEA